MSWQLERMMSADEYLLTIHRLGMSQAAAARFLGVSVRQSSYMARGERAVPAATALLLRAMLEHGDKPVVPKRNHANRY